LDVGHKKPKAAILWVELKALAALDRGRFKKT
jgi:hypothetical protein